MKNNQNKASGKVNRHKNDVCDDDDEGIDLRNLGVKEKVSLGIFFLIVFGFIIKKHLEKGEKDD